MDADKIQKCIFSNQSEGNGLRGRPRNHRWDCVQGDLKKLKIFYLKKRPSDLLGMLRWQGSIELLVKNSMNLWYWME